MQIVILVITILILSETTFLCIRHSAKNPARQNRQIFVDTSVLIDGRILDVARTGFIGDTLVIPRSVIRELQLLADGNDHEKRMRARQGMDAANDLQRVEQVNVEILADPIDHTKVDDRLIELAQKTGGAILTNDFNLNKVATAEGIEVLNLNALAMALQPKYEAGEHLKVRVTEKGSNPGQGVAYADDGTMIVIEDASTRITQEAEVEITRVMQTTSGRMMFARPVTKKKGKKN